MIITEQPVRSTEDLIFIIDDEEEYLNTLGKKLRDNGLNVECHLSQRCSARAMAGYCEARLPTVIVTSLHWRYQEAVDFIELTHSYYRLIIITDTYEEADVIGKEFLKDPSITTMQREDPLLIEVIKDHMEIISQCDDDSPVN